jgi:hypothetical protein
MEEQIKADPSVAAIEPQVETPKIKLVCKVKTKNSTFQY